MNRRLPIASNVVLQVEHLKVDFKSEGRTLTAVNRVSFEIRRGQILALVGESGCGKSVTSYAILGLIQSPGEIAGGRILFHSEREGEIDVTSLREYDPQLLRLRGGLVGMIFQEPMTALSPVHTIGSHLVEAIHLHQGGTEEEARHRGIEMLRKVGMSAPERRIDQYPHEISGGMRQRVMIAIALICGPELLVADEPTTALDTTIQAQILSLVKNLQKETHCSVLLVTHDLGIVAQTADDVAVMYLGSIVEHGPVRDILRTPRHPYTQGLLQSVASLGTGRRLDSISGTVPSLSSIPAGCPFHPRCSHARPGLCDIGDPPPMRSLEPERTVACLRAGEIAVEQGIPIVSNHG